MDAGVERRDQVLAALSAAPLDRVRLMKTAFLVWHRNGRPADGPFDFRPYLYGPCAFDLYDALEILERRGRVARAPHIVFRWAPYHLTEAGRQAAARAVARLGARRARELMDTARWAARQSFRSLLARVYEEAPDFAASSLLREG